MGWSSTIYVKDSILWCLGKSVQIKNTWVRATQNRIGIVRHGDSEDIDAQLSKIEDNGEKEHKSETTARENRNRSSGQESKGIQWRWRRRRYMLSVERKRLSDLFGSPWMAISCQKRSPRFDKFPNVSYHFCVFHAIFIMTAAKFFIFMFIHFLSVFTTRKAQHNTHSMQYPQYAAHYITSHHITFCTCLVLILVVMAAVSAQAVVVGTLQRRRRRHNVRFVPFCFCCLFVMDLCWIAWFSFVWRGVFGPEKWWTMPGKGTFSWWLAAILTCKSFVTFRSAAGFLLKFPSF